jgi:hypothetical protein
LSLKRQEKIVFKRGGLCLMEEKGHERMDQDMQKPEEAVESRRDIFLTLE